MEVPDVVKMTIEKDIPGLIAALSHKDWRIREEAVRGLGTIGDERAVEPLFYVAWKDEEAGEMVEDMGEYGIYSFPLRTLAREALDSIISRIGVLAVEPLIAHNESGQWGSEITHPLLVKIGSPAVEPLIAELVDEVGFKREAAALVLGDIGDTRAVEPLIATLRDTKYEVREAAAEALGKIGDTRAREALFCALKDGWEDVRVQAALALGKMRDPRAVESLEAALNHPNSLWGQAAVQALSEIGNARAVEALIFGLRGFYGSVRQQSAEALGRIGDPRAVEPLAAILRDATDSSAVREAARKALEEIRSKG